MSTGVVPAGSHKPHGGSLRRFDSDLPDLFIEWTSLEWSRVSETRERGFKSLLGDSFSRDAQSSERSAGLAVSGRVRAPLRRLRVAVIDGQEKNARLFVVTAFMRSVPAATA